MSSAKNIGYPLGVRYFFFTAEEKGFERALRKPSGGRFLARRADEAIKANIDCQGTIWHKDFGHPFDKEKIGAVQEMVYIGGQEYTYPAIRKITYIETADGVVTKRWAEQTVYPSMDDIINGTYVEKFAPVDP